MGKFGIRAAGGWLTATRCPLLKKSYSAIREIHLETVDGSTGRSFNDLLGTPSSMRKNNVFVIHSKVFAFNRISPGKLCSYPPSENAFALKLNSFLEVAIEYRIIIRQFGWNFKQKNSDLIRSRPLIQFKYLCKRTLRHHLRCALVIKSSRILRYKFMLNYLKENIHRQLEKSFRSEIRSEERQSLCVSCSR